jgi:hypothetical protein
MLAFEEERQLVVLAGLRHLTQTDELQLYLFRRLGRPQAFGCGLIDVQVAS